MTGPRAALVRTYVPALVGAGASVLMARTLPVSPFFLVPIGIVSLTGSLAPALLCAALAVLLNFAIVCLSAGPSVFTELFALISDTSYFSALVFSFAWASVRSEKVGHPASRLSVRMIAASAISTIVLFVVLLAARKDQAVVDFFKIQASAIVEAFKAAAGADVVQKSLLEREITPESVMKTFSDIVTRGALIGHLLFFGVSWRIAQMLASFRNPALRSRVSLLSFRNSHSLVWLLIASLFAVIAAERSGNEAFIAVAWNLMLLCVCLYAVQGAAVVLHNLSRPGIPPLLRSLIVFAAVLIVFRPGINAAVGIALAVVGVAENWLPLRAPIKTEPPSTPEA